MEDLARTRQRGFPSLPPTPSVQASFSAAARQPADPPHLRRRGRPHLRGRGRPRGASHHLDSRRVSGCVSGTLVARDKRRVEHFCQSHVDSIVGAEIVPQLPNAWQEEFVRMPPQREVGEVDQSLAPKLRSNLASRCKTAHDLRDLRIHQVRCMQHLPCSQQPRLNDVRSRSAQQHFYQGRCIDDYHRLSRSARTASADDIERVVPLRLARRDRSSSSVGRSDTSRISLSR